MMTDEICNERQRKRRFSARLWEEVDVGGLLASSTLGMMSHCLPSGGNNTGSRKKNQRLTLDTQELGSSHLSRQLDLAVWERR